jgi:hypothetical protein
MDSEYLKQRAQLVYDEIGPDFGASLENLLRTIATEAMEQSAQVVEWHNSCSQQFGCRKDSNKTCQENAAEEIRALKSTIAFGNVEPSAL